nr:hypothetical protein [Sulfurospirillum sp. 'SP']
MSQPAVIDLPSPQLQEGPCYTTQLLSTYLRVKNSSDIRFDIAKNGYYLAKGENADHEDIALEALMLKLQIALMGKIEERKNSWINSLNRNLEEGNDKAVASMLASIWRRLLVKTSLKKAEISAYGYALNGYNRSKSNQNKKIKALCEWCNKEITVPVEKGFTCPHCNTYFADFKPQKMKIKKDFESFYVENFEKDDEHSVLQKIEIGEFELKKSKKKMLGNLLLHLFLG